MSDIPLRIPVTEETRAIQPHLEAKSMALVSRLKAGDRSAATELVAAYYRQIYWFMRRLGHSREVSEDLTQETFFQAWYKIEQLRSDGSFKPWLYRIAGNIAKGYAKKYGHKFEIGVEEIDEPLQDESGTQRIEDEEVLEELNQDISRLSVKLKEAIVLHYLQNLTIAEAAEAAGIRQGTLKSRLNRALSILRKRLDKHD